MAVRSGELGAVQFGGGGNKKVVGAGHTVIQAGPADGGLQKNGRVVLHKGGFAQYLLEGLSEKCHRFFIGPGKEHQEFATAVASDQVPFAADSLQ